MVTLFIILVLLGLSFLITAALVFFISLLAPFTFSWSIALVVWLIAILFKWLFN